MHYNEDNTTHVFCDCCKKVTHKDDIKCLYDCTTHIYLEMCLECYQRLESAMKSALENIHGAANLIPFSIFMFKCASDGVVFKTDNDAYTSFLKHMEDIRKKQNGQTTQNK